MDTITTVSDVQERLGRPLTEAETTQVGKWIEDLEAQVRYRIPTLDQNMLTGQPPRPVVVGVIAKAVIRKVNNPEGHRQRTRSIDDFSETITIDATGSAGDLYLTDEEWNLLSPGSAGDAFTIRSAGATDAGPYDPWTMSRTWSTWF